MAVAVRRTPHLVLDEDYTIVEVGPAAEAGFGVLRGQNLWDAFPGAKPLFRPHFETARRGGRPVEFVQFYDGLTVRIRAVPDGRRLLLFWQLLSRLCVLTLESLRASLDATMRAIADAEASIRRDALRVLPGGAR